MNCPNCQQPVGVSNFARGAWKPVKDEFGIAIGLRREIHTHCESCGIFETIISESGDVVSADGPITDAKRLRKIEAAIPGCRDIVRLSA